jgi:hypothetical protein
MKKNIVIFWFFLRFSAALLSNSVIAGDVKQIKIASIMSTQSVKYPSSGGALFLNLPAGVTHESPCGDRSNYRYAIKGDDKMLISQALMAFASNRTVDIIGDGNCDAWADTEQVKFLVVY